jgi:predicted amidohydrolase YtcJ
MHSIFYNATILTQNPAQPIAQAMAIRNGRIEAVGTNEAVLKQQTSDTKIIDAQGKTLLPGFNDAHIHIWKVGNLLTYMLDVRGIKSKAAMLDKIADYVVQNPHLEWIMVRGFNEAAWSEGQLPTRFDLDTIATDKPICVIRTCAHIAVVNSNALAICNITTQTPVPTGGEIRCNKEGTLLGILTETALGLVMRNIPPYTATQYKEMVVAAQNALVRYGITSATDPAVMPDLLDVYRAMEQEKKLFVRINAVPIQVPDGDTEALPLPEKYQSDFLVVDTVKFFSDGGLSGKTAALNTPYKNTTDEYGVLRLTYDFFLPLAQRARAAGWKIATHAIGDKAIDMVLEVYKKPPPTSPKEGSSVEASTGFTPSPLGRAGVGMRIEHLALPSPQNLADMKALGCHAVPQTIFIYELGKNFRNYLSEDYLQNCYPIKKILDAGINVALSSDAPVVKDFNPMQGIQAAVRREDTEDIQIAPEQAISVEQALYAYTMGGAKAHDLEQEQGSIEVGKRADFIFLAQNPLDVPSKLLNTVQVLETYIGGERVFGKG